MAQKAAKRWFRRRNEAASTIQQAVRKFLLHRRQKKFEQAIIKAQVRPLPEESDQSDEPGWKVFMIRCSGDANMGLLTSSLLLGLLASHLLLLLVQALWRGHRSRRLHDTLKLVKLRQRLQQLSADVREEDRLGNKTSSALDYLLRYKHFTYILEGLKNLGWFVC